MTEIEDFITKKTVSWADETNLIISPKFNWQDGWYTVDDDGKWEETDKPADNRCFLDVQCPVDECCMNWPDQLNRRCQPSTIDKILNSAGPVSFTPSCPSLTAEDAVPENAQDDIAQGALSEAEEALTSFANSRKSDAKDKDGYADLTEEEQATWDEEWAAAEAKTDEWRAELKELAGFADDTCDIACQAIVEEKILEAEKQIYDYCNDDASKTKVDCLEGEELSKKEWAQKGKDYFTGDADARATKDSEWTDAKDAEKANIIALAPKPEADSEGGACGAESKCTAEAMCCGKRYPFNAAIEPAAEDADEDAEERRVGQEDSVCGPNTNEDGSNAGYTGAFDL